MAGRRQCTEFDADEALFRILEESDVDDDNYEDSDMSSSEEEMIDRDSDSESDQTTPMADIPSTSTSVPLPKRARKRGRPVVVSPPQPEFNWGKTPPKTTIPQFGEAAGIRSRGISPTSSPLDCFMQFFTVQVINLIVDMTNLNAEKKLQDINALRVARQLSPQQFNPTSFEEMKAFLGLTIAMGIVKLPRLSMYWQQKHWIFSVPSFARIMSRDRFLSISRFLHFCNEIDAPSRDDPAPETNSTN